MTRVCKWSRPPAFVALFLISASAVPLTPTHAQTLGEIAELKQGPYAVGFRAEFGIDQSRPFLADSTGRPMRLFIWYPAKRTPNASHLTMAAYLNTRPENPVLQVWNAAMAARDSGTARRQFSQADKDSAYERLLQSKTWSTAAPPATGRFPMVVHSLGLNDFQLESTVLWEFLASHGYVVAVVPQIGASPTVPRSSFNKSTIELQASDVEFALRLLTGQSGVDSKRIGLIGHSIGGAVALVVASRHEEIRAVVSLDGSATLTDGKLALDSIEWRPGNVRAAVLNIYRLPQPKLNLTTFDALASKARYDVPIRTATHFDFQNWPLYASLSRMPDERSSTFRTPEVGRGVVKATALLTLDFLDLELKKKRSSGMMLRNRRSIGTAADSLLSIDVR